MTLYSQLPGRSSRSLLRQTFKLSTDPQLIEKVRDIVGLYLTRNLPLGSLAGGSDYTRIFFANWLAVCMAVPVNAQFYVAAGRQFPSVALDLVIR